MIISYAQNFEDIILWRALKHVTRGVYIDVGANDPIIDSVTQLFYEHQWSGINIEPLAIHWQALQNTRVRDINLQCAVGACESEITMWSCDIRGWASADKAVVAHHTEQGHFGLYTTVKQRSLNSIWMEYGLEEVHFLKVDVEGYESAVLEGIDLHRHRPWIIVVEANRPASTEEVYVVWEPWLVAADYRFVYADGLNRFYLAAERFELSSAFKYPPNFFDDFVKAPHLESNRWALELAESAEARVAHAEALAKAAIAEKNQAESRVLSLLSSTSWRITLPLRVLSVQFQIILQFVRNIVRLNWIAEAVISIKKIKPKLAFVSPFPPVRSGIADYAAELLSRLTIFYEIEIIIEQPDAPELFNFENLTFRSYDWFLSNNSQYDRVLYHFGNSCYHQRMLQMLAQVPGVVVLHDFFLGDLLIYLEAYAINPFAFHRGLYKSHGYAALAKLAGNVQSSQVAEQYPANFEILQLARGVIVHSQHSRQLAERWYGINAADSWVVIPLLRNPCKSLERTAARAALGLQEGDFMVCSFGLMTPNKLNHRLLQVWLDSALTASRGYCLVFVGEEHGAEYGGRIRQGIEAAAPRHNVRITGWTQPDQYAQYLTAADLAVQLRTNSRGETSAAVLDCLNHGLPTIVNAHGALAELPTDAVWMLEDDFDDVALAQAIEALSADQTRRDALGIRGQAFIQAQHAPENCAKQYNQAIECAYAGARVPSKTVLRSTDSPSGEIPDETQYVQSPFKPENQKATLGTARKLLIDVSATCRTDLKTGIQRVVRALVWSFIQVPPEDFRVEPVYLRCDTGEWHYCYARAWTSQVLGVASGWLPDEPVDSVGGDVLLVADLSTGVTVDAEQAGVFAGLKACGVHIHFIVYDLLPIRFPHFFPPHQSDFERWLRSLTGVADGAICISQTVAKDLQHWMNHFGPEREKGLLINWFHLGADLVNSLPSMGMPAESAHTLDKIASTASFLMVGTIEPRKGYLQALRAFTEIWKSGLNVNLVIVGREGWKGLLDAHRQTIPEIVGSLQMHPELGGRLLWLDDVSDEYLRQIYANSSCLIAASEGEGFGLPLAEAAQIGLPIIARDIPVFREILGDYAHYFSGLDAHDLAHAIKNWISSCNTTRPHTARSASFCSWTQSSRRILEIMEIVSAK